MRASKARRGVGSDHFKTGNSFTFFKSALRLDDDVHEDDDSEDAAAAGSLSSGQRDSEAKKRSGRTFGKQMQQKWFPKARKISLKKVGNFFEQKRIFPFLFPP